MSGQILTYREHKPLSPWGPRTLALTPESARCKAREPIGTNTYAVCNGRILILGEHNIEWGFVVQRYVGQGSGKESNIALTYCEECGIVKAARKEQTQP